MLPLPPNGKRYRQGIFIPTNKEKYIGKEPARFLSSLELKFFRWADKNPNVIHWSSESVIIPYLNPVDGRMHKYYTDAFLVLKEGDKLQKYIVEIKPKSQTVPPVQGKQRKKTLLFEVQRWAQNQAKWKFTEDYCKRNNMRFQILTEENLK